MKRFLLFLLVLILPVQSMAASLPAYSPKFGNSLAGVIQQKVAARGFSANDPRFIATEAAIGTALTGAAAGLAAAAGAPLWATVAIGAVVAGAVALGIGAATQWLFNADGTVTPVVAGEGETGGSPSHTFWTYRNTYWGTVYYGSFADVATKSAIFYTCGTTCPASITWGTPSPCSPLQDGGICTGTVEQLCSGCAQTFRPYTVHIEASSWVPPADSEPVQGNALPPTPKKISDAVADVPESDMVKAANPELVAEAANKWWQQAAAQPGYQGLPYVASDPITTQDVSNWQQANPSTYPTVSDMLAPAVNPATSTVPQPVAPGTAADPGIQTGAQGQPSINLGVDPVVPLPTLEATPTAQMILNPLLNLFPDLKAFVVPAHAAECPKPSMTLFGRLLLLDGHCGLLESIRPTLYAVMAAVWVVVALFIILAA